MPLGDIAPSPTNPPPLVEIVASDAVAGEFGANPARFSVVCPNGTNAAPLTVNYSVGGTATPGLDYAALPGNVIIPSGATSANIYVTPLGNHLASNQATVTVSLSASTNYVLTNLASATVTILDRPLNAWLRANFSTAELGNPAISGDAADPDHDGLPNLMEYALGLKPGSVDTTPFAATFTNGIFTVTYPLSDAATDVSLVPEWSTNLATWLSGPNYIQQINQTDNGSTQTITITRAAPSNSGFFRFHVSRR